MMYQNLIGYPAPAPLVKGYQAALDASNPFEPDMETEGFDLWNEGRGMREAVEAMGDWLEVLTTKES